VKGATIVFHCDRCEEETGDARHVVHVDYEGGDLEVEEIQALAEYFLVLHVKRDHK
jgi:hypothetical protein